MILNVGHTRNSIIEYNSRSVSQVIGLHILCCQLIANGQNPRTGKKMAFMAVRVSRLFKNICLMSKDVNDIAEYVDNVIRWEV